MAAAGDEVPDRVAYETLRGDVTTGEVVDDEYETQDCRPVQLLQVQVSDRNTRWFERDEVVAVDPERVPSIPDSALADDES